MKAGWNRSCLDEVCDLITDGSHFSPKSTNAGYPYITVRDISEDGIDFENCKFVDETSFRELSKNGCDPTEGDLLFSKDGTVGKVALVGNVARFVVLSSLAIIRPNTELVDPKYLKYCLISPDFLEAALGRKTGVAIRRIILKNLKTIPIRIAPILEQKRIVAILDETFDGITTAKANTKKNLQNAREVFESHLQAIFNSRGSGWERIPLEVLLDRGWIEGHLDGNHGGDYPRKEEFIAEGVPYISANCLDGDRLDMSRAKYLSRERAALLRKGIAKNNDVLFAHNATVGPVSILQTSEPKVILGTSLTYYRCNPNYILPEYLAHYMRSFGFKSQYTSIMRQSTRNQVPITKQREFYHVIPPVNEQRAIIDQLDGLMENSQQLECILQQKLTALDDLKQSLLHRAFSGQL